MNRYEAREQAKGRLEEYLRMLGVDPGRNFNCLNPAHEDHNPSMNFDRRRNRVHCFACGVDWDIFDLARARSGGEDMGGVFAHVYNALGMAVDGFEPGGYSNPTETAQRATGPNKGDLEAYLAQAHRRLEKTDYPARRGISNGVARRFALGFDPAFGTRQGEGRVMWQAVIIPTGPDSYVARNTDMTADKKNRVRKTGHSRVFNFEATAQGDSPCFVVEGEFDALSVEECAGHAVALGGIANIGQFLRLAERQRPKRPLILALDQDEEGRRAEGELADGLERLKIAFWRACPFEGYKDANEALLSDREAFTEALRHAEGMEGLKEQARREEYFSTSAQAHIGEFMQGVAKSVQTPAIPTGYAKLDEALDGGLYEGLYIIGAITSLGKTTFVLQMADQMAMEGQDVLIFSLEMARSELMAKSISRHTLLACLAGGAGLGYAKTARGITAGKRYANYSLAEKQGISRAVGAYGEYAKHIYINEGIGDIGTKEIRQRVREHIDITGNTPVVVVDYLQILSPYNERFSDKQNTDRAVLELKRLSRDYKLPVVGISSFNRQNYREAVTMEAFKESGAIEYSSDVLIGLQLKGAGTRDFDAYAQKKKDPREVELKILKNRNGQSGVALGYDYYALFNYFLEG